MTVWHHWQEPPYSIIPGQKKVRNTGGGSALFSLYCTLHIAVQVSRRRSVLLCRVAQSLCKQPHPPSTCSGSYSFLYLNSFSLERHPQKILLKDYTLSGKFPFSSLSLIYPLPFILPATIHIQPLFIPQGVFLYPSD